VPAFVTINVTRGTAVTVFVQFTKPTQATFTLTERPIVTQVAATPTTVYFKWWWEGKYATATTWKYGSGHVTKLKTGLYVATITTTDGTTAKIIGVCTGTGGVKATAQWTITVQKLRTQ
jgi:hypothetical protein